MIKLEATAKQFCDQMHISARDVNSGLSLRHTILVKKSQKKLWNRLLNAIDAGVVFTNLKVVKDVHGNEYISSETTVMDKYLNSCLNNLGF